MGDSSSGDDSGRSKRCSKCRKTKPLTSFYRRSRSKDGHAAKCIECVKVYKKEFYAANAERLKAEVREHYADPKNAEKKRVYQRDFYANNRDYYADWQLRNRDKLLARQAELRKENPAKYRARDKRYRDKYRERRREQFAEWRKKYPDRMRAAKQRWNLNNYEKVLESARICDGRRRARKAAATTVNFSVEELAQRWAYWGDRCYLCGEDAEQTDHVKPLAAGGANMLCNLRPICAKCNQRKNDRWPLTEAEKRGRRIGSVRGLGFTRGLVATSLFENDG